MARLPDRIDKYPIEELIATGGMGAVYRGTHPTLERSVIIKKLTLRGDKAIAERFRREAKILMDFRHDHIVDVFDHFTQGRTNYIVMEYVDGMSARDLIEQERYLDGPTAAWILLYTARALKYAHTKGVIHRDIKPANILVSRDGEVKLADFGIAANRDAGEDTLTGDGATLGTPAYMPPEQFENSRTVDYRADIYSMGVMLYELLCGQKPFPGGFSPDVIQAIQKGRYRRPRRVIPSVPRTLQRLIAVMMRPRRNRRIGDLAQVISRLEAYLARFEGEDVRGRLSAMIRGEEPPVPRRRNPRRPLLRLAAAALVLTAAAASAAYGALTGVHLRFLRPADYGQIRIEVEGETQAAAEIFIDDGAEMPPASRSPRMLPSGEGSASLPLVLPAGQYRVKTRSADRVVWTSFRLEPWSRRGRTLRITVPASPPAPGPVEVGAVVTDEATGRFLDAARLLVPGGGGFVPVDAAPDVISGGVRRFRVAADGYFPQDFVLRLEPGQRRLELRAALVPLPGTLILDFPAGDPDFLLRIDGRSSVDEVLDGIIVRSDLDIASDREYRLLPGSYQAKITGEQWSITLDLAVYSSATTVLTIDPAAGSARAEQPAGSPGQ
jgi:hypothetical protein